MHFYNPNAVPSGEAGFRIAGPASVSAIVPPSRPVLVDDAMEFVALMNHVRRYGGGFEGASTAFRDLTEVEETTYESALSALNAYFQGRKTYERKAEVVEVVKGQR